jgi:hypothetical protein
LFPLIAATIIQRKLLCLTVRTMKSESKEILVWKGKKDIKRGWCHPPATPTNFTSERTSTVVPTKMVKSDGRDEENRAKQQQTQGAINEQMRVFSCLFVGKEATYHTIDPHWSEEPTMLLSNRKKEFRGRFKTIVRRPGS